MWAGKIKVAWLIDLIHHLEVNPRSRVHQLVTSGELVADRWDQTHRILADIFDLIAAVNQAQDRDDQPVRYPRPGRKPVDGDGRDPRLFAKTLADFDIDAWNRLL